MNTGSFPIVLKNDDGSTGTAANRFALPGDVNLTPKQNVILMYNSTATALETAGEQPCIGHRR